MADPFGGLFEAGAGLVGNILNQNTEATNAAQQQAILQQMLAKYKDIPLPVLQQIAAQQVNSQAAQAGSDPALEAQQYAGQGQLQNIIDNGGMTLADKANAQQAQNLAGQKANATRQGLLNMLSRQGVSPSATSAALQLGAAKTQQDQDSNAGLQQAASAQQRAYQAVLDRQKNAAAMQNQQFSQAFQKGQAADAIAKYNADARTSAARYGNTLGQQNYDNQMGQAGAENGVLTQQMGQNNNYTNQQTASTAAAAAAGGKTLGSIADMASGGADGAGAGAGGAGSYGQFASAPTQFDEEG